MANTPTPPQKYGCHNRQLKTSYQTSVRDINSAENLVVLRMVTIINTMSKDCHYDLRSTDVRCTGCVWIDTIPMPF